MSKKKVDYTVVLLQSKLTIGKDEDKKGKHEEFLFYVVSSKKSSSGPGCSNVG